MEIMVKAISLDHLGSLMVISRQTFAETFASDNKEEDLKEYLENSFSEDKLSKELSNPHSEFYFAYVDGILAGYLKMNIKEAQTEIDDQNALEIERIYILQSHQGKGIGKLLFDTAVKRAQEHKVDFIWLGVWEKNEKAIAFYEKNGFIHFGKHVFILGKDKQTDLMMRLPITK